MFVPRGVGNAFQTLEPRTAYSYLVNDHWSPAAKDSYTFVNLADETLAIDWPIPLDGARALRRGPRTIPRLADVVPMRPAPTADLGADGQLGRALRARAARRRARLTRAELDLDRPGLGRCLRLRAVRRGDQRRRLHRGRRAPRRRQGRRDAWAINVTGVGALVRAGARAPVHAGPRLVRLRLRRDGRACTTRTSRSHRSASTARPRPPATRWSAGVPRHYVVRTSWVIGDGNNFVAHHGIAGRPRGRARRWSTTSSAGSPSPTSSPPGSSTCSTAGRRSAPTT